MTQSTAVERATSPLPIEIELPEGVPLDDGAMFVRLYTIQELERFWRKHQAMLPFVASGAYAIGPAKFLRPGEWIFGPSKESVVRWATRWIEVGTETVWYAWDEEQIESYANMPLEAILFCDAAHNAFNVRQRRDGVEGELTGWWLPRTLPGSEPLEDWFSEHTDMPASLTDSSLPSKYVSRLLQRYIFDSWERVEGPRPFDLLDGAAMEGFFRQHMEDRLRGHEHYSALWCARYRVQELRAMWRSTCAPEMRSELFDHFLAKPAGKSSSVVIEKVEYHRELDVVVLHLSPSERLFVPREKIGGLERASCEEMLQMEIYAERSAVVWPLLRLALVLLV